MRLKKRTLSLLLAALLIVPTCGAVTQPAYAAETDEAALTYYVAPNGSDSAAGTEDAPFATIAKARDTIRALAASSGLPDGGITVYLREGNYYQAETLKFTAEDSGTEACPITYKSYEGETATITGGYVFDTSKFTKPSAEILACNLTDDAKANLVAYDLKAAGVDYALGDLAVGIDSRLYLDGERGWPGRYPNDDRETYAYLQVQDLSGVSFVDSRPANWAEESIKGARVYGMFEIDYFDSRASVASFDKSTNRVTLKNVSTGMNSSARYFYYNVLEEIDEPGEYYVDRDSGILYMYAPENYKNMHITFAQCENYVISAEVNHYTFDDLIIECCVGGIIKVVGDNNTIQNCTVRNSGHDRGIYMYGYENYIYNNELYFLGAGGIFVGGGNDKLYIPSDTTVDNNLIHDYAELHRVYNGAITAGDLTATKDYVGFTVSHNEIYNGPHIALDYFANDAIFEYNYIHDVCYEGGDAGAVYDGTWRTGGMIFRHNILKDIRNEFNIYMTPLGYYCDDSGGGKQVYSNLFINIDGAGICTTGQDNFVHDNILVNTRGIYTDSRSYYKFPADTINGWTTSCVFGVGAPNGLWAWMMDSTWNPGYASEAWAMRYPWTMLLKTTNVYDIYDNFVGYGFGDSSVRQNVVSSSGDVVFTTNTTERLINKRDNIRMSNINSLGFADYEGGDYTVTDESMIYHELPGFKPCDFANVGVQPVD